MKIFPLTTNQKRYVLAERFTAACYMISVCHRIEGQLDLERLRSAARALVARHSALRTAFRPVHGSYQSVVGTEMEPQFHIIELDNDSFASFRDAALPLIMHDVDVETASSLVRFVVGRVAGGQNWRVCFSAHHAVSDGISRSMAMKELFALYDGKVLPPAQSFYDIPRTPTVNGSERSYWEQALKDFQPGCRLIPDSERRGGTELGRFVEDRLDFDAVEYRRLVHRTGTSSFGCMAAVYALGLMRLTGHPSPMFVFQSAGRKAILSSISVFGPFSNTLPLVINLNLGVRFADLAKEMQRRVDSAVQNERLPFSDILRLLPTGPDFSLNAFPRERLPLAEGLIISPREFLDRQSEFAINLVWSQDGSAMVGRAYFDAGRLSAERVANFLRAQKQLMQRGLMKPHASLSDLLSSVSGSLSKGHILSVPAPAVNVIERVMEQALRTPHAIAIRSASETLSYEQLAVRSRAFGSGLQASGLRSADRVAIFGSRSADLVAACLGAACAGATFVVLDPRTPIDRLQRQVTLLRPRFLIRTCTSLTDIAPWANMTDVAPLDEGAPWRFLGPTSREPLYILFTSGTTGRSKGVGHGPEILTLFTDWARAQFKVGTQDCVTMLSGLNHDPLMRDIFLPLSSGACLAIPSDEDFGDPARLRGWLREVGATVVNLTPPLGRLLAMGAEETALSGVRLLIWGGDELMGRQVRQFQGLAPNAIQVNLYGATETPQAAALSVLPPQARAHWRSMPIGTSVGWMRTECITDDGRLCGSGEVGTLRVTMPFSVHILHSNSDGGAAVPVPLTVHNTADRAYVDADGQMVYIGRTDDQIKIRGFRTDPNEVAAALESLREVQSAIVLPVRLADDTTALEAFCQAEPGSEVNSLALMVAVKRLLPHYMVPHRLTIVHTFPLLPNGKIDRSALVALGAAHEIQSAPAKAESALFSLDQQRIAAVYARFSGRKAPSSNSSLAELGADSLATIEARLELESLGIELPTAWELLSIQDLALLLRPPEDDIVKAPTTLIRLESFVAIRAIAITMIVALHVGGYDYGGGATTLLFIIAGFIFAKWMLPAMLREDKISQLWILLGKVLVTVLPVSIAIVVWQAGHHRPVHSSTLGLFANFVTPIDKSVEEGWVFWLWYIHSYLQAFFILGFMLSFAAVRRVLRRGAFLWAIALSIGCLLSVGAWVLAQGSWSQPGLSELPLERMPITALALIGIGAGVALADTPLRKVTVLLTGAVVATAFEAVFENENVVLTVLGVVILLFLPWLRVPRMLGWLMLRVSGGSLFIYVLHWPLAQAVALISPGLMHPVFLTIAIIASCVLLWPYWRSVLWRIFMREVHDWPSAEHKQTIDSDAL